MRRRKEVALLQLPMEGFYRLAPGLRYYSADSVMFLALIVIIAESCRDTALLSVTRCMACFPDFYRVCIASHSAVLLALG